MLIKIALTTIVLFFILNYIYSQNNLPIICSATYKVLLTKNTKAIISDSCQLDISNGSSLFYSLNKRANEFKMVKIIKESLESGLPFEINMNNHKTEVPYEIEKKWSTGRTIVIDKIGDQTFGFPKDKVQSWSWELLKDTATINSYFCNKAQKKVDTVITTVWYCNSIPYPDGPLTNFGLAGLIIKSESNNGWSAEITSLQQFTHPHLFLQTPKYVLVTEAEFIKARKAMKEKNISNKELTNDDGTIKVIKQ